MSQNKKPGPDDFKAPPEGVISLCAHRRRHQIAVQTCELIDHLTRIHDHAISIHNQIIERARLSVLTEFCRAAGLCFDLVAPQLRAAVVTPAALYGDSGGAVFGKKPLQERIIRSLSAEFEGPQAREILTALNGAHPIVWDYRARPDLATDLATPLAGPTASTFEEMAGVIVRKGTLSRESGVYSGWNLHYRDIQCIIFGYRLDRSREVAVRNFLASRENQKSPTFWSSIELPLLRSIVDPDNRHQRPDRGLFTKSPVFGFRQAATRRGLLLAIRRTLWRHFAEPSHGLTIHAHIAALIDDPESRQAFLEEAREIADTVTIKSGGLRDNEEPITLDDVLAPFFLDGQGRLLHQTDLTALPCGLLLPEPQILAAANLTAEDPLSKALAWVEENAQTPEADWIESAWMTFRTEQNLAATYGLALGQRPEGDTPALPFARQSAVLPNIRTLFDPRFMSHSLADLDLPDEDRARLDTGLHKIGTDLQGYTLDDVSQDERNLTYLHGVNHDTCNALRRGLLELAADWRWRTKNTKSTNRH